MRLAVITPVGPGHENVVVECEQSVIRAWENNSGPFDGFSHTVVEDTEGKLGRSKARNAGIDFSTTDWFFFLDADDLCHRDAFLRFGEVIGKDPRLTAVFGAVCTKRNESKECVVGENAYPLNWDKLLRLGPRGTLSMGCFVRSDAARQTRFDESMDAGEDFDFYLRLLKDRSWTKIKQPLAVIRTNVPSAGGPRGYERLDWRAVCQGVVDKWLQAAHQIKK